MFREIREIRVRQPSEGFVRYKQRGSLQSPFVTTDMPHAIITISATAAAVADNIGMMPLRQGITCVPYILNLQ